MHETFTCPETPKDHAFLAHWERWHTTDREAAQLIRRESALAARKSLHELPESFALWPWSYLPVPRRCTWCGSAHPDDVLCLLLEGWCLVIVEDRRARRMEPPGPDRVAPDVMLRLSHFPIESREAVNNALKVRDAKFADAAVTPVRMSPRRTVEPPPMPRLASSKLRGVATIRDAGYTGNTCGDCGGVRMTRSGTCEKCEDCGGTSGCS